MNTPLHLALGFALLTAALAAPLPGQIVSPGIPSPPNPWTSPLAPKQLPGLSPIYKRGFQGMDSTLPEFQGFPTFPPNAAGYGGYTLPPASLVALPEFFAGRLPPPAPEPRDDWPSWIRLELEAGTGAFAPSRAVLVRGTDRVWFLAPGEPAFVPLAYHDKVRVLEGGSQIQVRNQGEFQVSFFGGTRMNSQGPVALQIQELSEERIAIRLDTVTRLHLNSRSQPVVVQLLGSTLLQMDQQTQGGTDLFLQREAGHVWVHNWGPGTVVLRSPLRVQGLELLPDHRVTLWVAPHRAPVLATDLSLEGALQTLEHQGSLEVTGGSGGGAVTWSGARIRVTEGAVLTLDSLGAGAFPRAGDRQP